MVHQQLRSQGDGRRPQHQQPKLPPEAPAPGLRRLCLTPEPPQRKDKIEAEEPQEQEACPLAKVPLPISRKTVDPCRQEEEERRKPCLFPLRRLRMDGGTEPRDEGRVAEHGAHGVAVAQLSVALDSGMDGDHHLRQRGADGDHRGPHQSLRPVKALRRPHRPVHEPVPAPDQECEPRPEESQRQQHFPSLPSEKKCGRVRRPCRRSAFSLPRLRRDDALRRCTYRSPGRSCVPVGRPGPSSSAAERAGTWGRRSRCKGYS